MTRASVFGCDTCTVHKKLGLGYLVRVSRTALLLAKSIVVSAYDLHLSSFVYSISVGDIRFFNMFINIVQ